MKKILFTFLVLSFLAPVSIAQCGDCNNSCAPCEGVKNNCAQNTCEKNNCAKDNCAQRYTGNSTGYACDVESQRNTCDNATGVDKTPCSKNAKGCSIDDDEYCTYNECYFDKRFIKMKKALCLSAKQETCINTLYKNFKNDMEVYHSRYRAQKNKLLEMIECDNECYKEQVDVLKELRKDFKERCKTFRDDVKELLCKEQYSEFRKFQRQEKRKMKKLIKYSAIHKLPCCDCCSK